MSAGGPDRLRVAVVGTGGWGRQHARIFAGRADVELVGIAGRSPERTAARAAEHRTTPFTDLDEMITRTQPDLVSVCLPNEDHFEPTLQLIETGVDLFVEKPLVFDLAEADHLLARAAEQGIFFAINFNHRFAEPVLRARAAIQRGDLGELGFLTWRFGGEPNVGRSPHANLIETQCHGFDLLEHLGGPITSVAAQLGPLVEGAYRTMAVALSFASGAVGSLTGSYASSYAYPDTQLVEVNGSAGRVLIEDTVRRFTFSRSGDPVREVWEAGYFDDEARSFHLTFDRHVDRVLAALRAGDPPPVPATAGRRALELALATVASHETGGRIDTTPSSDSYPAPDPHP